MRTEHDNQIIWCEQCGETEATIMSEYANVCVYCDKLQDQHGYKAIAKIVKANTKMDMSTCIAYVSRNVIDDLADYFKRDDPRFDRDEFLAACGLD